MSKRSYMKQLVKRRSAARKAATLAKVKTWKMTEKLKVNERFSCVEGSQLLFVVLNRAQNVCEHDSE